MNRTISRDHDDYKKIEKYKNYEITPCIAFEMAIRNYNFKEIVGGIYDFYAKNKKLINYIMIPTAKKVSMDDNRKAAELYLEFIEMMKRRGLAPEHLEDSYSNHAIILNFFKIAKILNYSIPVLESTPSYTSDHDSLIYKREKKEGFTLVNKSNNNILDRSYKFGEITIENNFTCPKLYPDLGHNRVVLVPINFSLHTIEINDYITHLKKVIDRDSKIIAAPIELLGKKMEEANNIKKLCNSNTENECFDSRNGEMFKKKLADMLYIYDCQKQGMTKNEIMLNIDYYTEENIKESKKYTKISTNTYDKFYNIAKDYIDNSRYTELISGTKRSTNQIF